MCSYFSPCLYSIFHCLFLHDSLHTVLSLFLSFFISVSVSQSLPLLIILISVSLFLYIFHCLFLHESLLSDLSISSLSISPSSAPSGQSIYASLFLSMSLSLYSIVVSSWLSLSLTIYFSLSLSLFLHLLPLLISLPPSLYFSLSHYLSIHHLSLQCFYLSFSLYISPFRSVYLRLCIYVYLTISLFHCPSLHDSLLTISLFLIISFSLSLSLFFYLLPLLISLFTSLYLTVSKLSLYISLYPAGNYSRLACEIQFVRSMGYYLIQIYIPSSLIVVISWVSFWLNRQGGCSPCACMRSRLKQKYLNLLAPKYRWSSFLLFERCAIRAASFYVTFLTPTCGPFKL